MIKVLRKKHNGLNWSVCILSFYVQPNLLRGHPGGQEKSYFEEKKVWKGWRITNFVKSLGKITKIHYYF